MNDHWRRKYEEAFSRFADAQGARAFGLGRHALFILLKALGVNPGDKIGICAYTCLAVVEAVKVSGAIPVYFDIDEHLCIDPHEIVIQNKGTLKAVILQHTFGNPGRFDELLAACEKIGAIVIEDCAHTLDCVWDNKKLGKWCDAAIHPAGILAANSKELLAEVDRQIERYAAPPAEKYEFIGDCFQLIYRPLSHSQLDCFLGYTYSRFRNVFGMREISFLKNGLPSCEGYVRPAGEVKAKADLTKLENWQKIKKIRIDNTAMIEKYFSEAGLTLCPREAEAKITLMRYPLRVYKKWQIVHKAGMRGLDIAGWYISPVHPLNDNDLAKVDYRRGSCPGSEGTIERLVHLPTGPSLNKHKLEAMMKILNRDS
jgi:perosamine synthetase